MATTAIPSSAGGSAPSFRDDYSIRLSNIDELRIHCSSSQLVSFGTFVRRYNGAAGILIVDGGGENLQPSVRIRLLENPSAKFTVGESIELWGFATRLEFDADELFELDCTGGSNAPVSML